MISCGRAGGDRRAVKEMRADEEVAHQNRGRRVYQARRTGGFRQRVGGSFLQGILGIFTYVGIRRIVSPSFGFAWGLATLWWQLGLTPKVVWLYTQARQVYEFGESVNDMYEKTVDGITNTDWGSVLLYSSPFLLLAWHLWFSTRRQASTSNTLSRPPH